MLQLTIDDFYVPTDTEALEIKENFKSIGWDYSASLSIEEIKSIFENATTALCAKNDNGEIIGFIRSMDDYVWQANIDCLVVHKNYQHQGVGTALVKDLLNKLSKVKYKNVCTNDSYNAKFWHQFGFRGIGGKFLQRED